MGTCMGERVRVWVRWGRCKPRVLSGLPHCTPEHSSPRQTDISEDLNPMAISCGKVHLSKESVLLLSVQRHSGPASVVTSGERGVI